MEAVVIDAGSKLLKAGFAIPDQAPSMIIPTQMKIMNEDATLPDSPSQQANNVDPVVRGFIKDWDAMEDLLHHVLYDGLGWEIGNEGQILFADPLLTPKAVKEQLVQLLFETFNVSGFYASEQAVLSLYAVGRISGCTVDIGHGKIDIAPVIEGAVQHIASKRIEIGGADLTKLFAQELAKSNPHIKLDISEVEKLKEQYACCAEDELAYEKTLQSCNEEQHTLPDGQVISIKRERYTVGEALFQPSILGLEAHGLVEQLVRIISTVSSENHRQLLENTVLCGGTVSMTAYCQALKVLADQLANVDAPVENDRLVLQLLAGLPEQYEGISTILQNQKPLPSFYNARSKLIQAETDKAERALQESKTASTALAATTQRPHQPDHTRQNHPPTDRTYPSNPTTYGRNQGRPTRRNRGGRTGSGRGRYPQPNWPTYPFFPWAANWPTPNWASPQQSFTSAQQPTWPFPPCPYPTTNRPTQNPTPQPGLLGPRPQQAHTAYCPTDIEQALYTMSLQQPDPTQYMDTGASSTMSHESGLQDQGTPPAMQQQR